MNKMPELKAGMIIELKPQRLRGVSAYFVYIDNNLAFNIDSTTYISNITTNPDYPIIAIYNASYHDSLKDQDKDLKSRLIWERKSDTQRKIESIEATIESAMEELNKLKQLSE